MNTDEFNLLEIGNVVRRTSDHPSRPAKRGYIFSVKTKGQTGVYCHKGIFHSLLNIENVGVKTPVHVYPKEDEEFLI